MKDQRIKQMGLMYSQQQFQIDHGAEAIFEVIAENFSNLENINLHIYPKQNLCETVEC